jgi:ferredoxin
MDRIFLNDRHAFPSSHCSNPVFQGNQFNSKKYLPTIPFIRNNWFLKVIMGINSSSYKMKSKQSVSIGYANMAIYFMSGTGNTFRTCAWMAEHAEARGISAECIPIPDSDPKEEVEDNPDHIIGIAMPTHGFTLPWMVIKFLLKLPRVKSTGAFVLATRAAMKIGKVVTPGLSGTATFIAAFIMRLKGYRIRGIASIDMPSNWMSLHWGFSKESAEYVKEKRRPQAMAFVDKIVSGKRSILTVDNSITLVLGLALLPVSLGYLLIGRFFLAKLFFANNSCNGCGVCAANCPAGAIKMIWQKKPRPYWTYKCESCMRCMGYCQFQAIEASHSLGAIIFYITNIPIFTYLIETLSLKIAGFVPIDFQLVERFVRYPAFLAAVFICYFIFTLLIKVPFINTFFAYTTLTHFYRRYHEPDTKLTHLK